MAAAGGGSAAPVRAPQFNPPLPEDLIGRPRVSDTVCVWRG